MRANWQTRPRQLRLAKRKYTIEWYRYSWDLSSYLAINIDNQRLCCEKKTRITNDRTAKLYIYGMQRSYDPVTQERVNIRIYAIRERTELYNVPNIFVWHEDDASDSLNEWWPKYSAGYGKYHKLIWGKRWKERKWSYKLNWKSTDRRISQELFRNFHLLYRSDAEN